MIPEDKEALRAELQARLRADLETLERAHKAALEGATHEEAKPENDKDTRATEASYLARGQAARIDDVRRGLGAVSAMSTRATTGRVTLGALVIVEEEDREEALFLAPAGGGSLLAGGSVRVVTPDAPLGRALLAKEAGDDIELDVAGKRRSLTIARVV